ncbi:MAG: amidohydrolase family protein [Sphingobium sp.]
MPGIVDIHTHFFPRSWPDLAERFGGDDWPWMRHDDEGTATVMIGRRPFRPVYNACWDAGVRLSEMDRDGVDQQLLCATPVLFGYGRPVHQALELARIFNDAALEICDAGEGRLHALCQVPLQDTDAAVRELERCVAAGHRGVQIGNHVGDRDLDHEALIAFLERAAELDASVLVHPWDMLGTGSSRFDEYMLPWLVSMPAETQLSILRLILSGAFERLPRSLRLCFAHGGGSFPYLLGRVENAWHQRDIVRKDCPHPPSYYLKRMHVDSAVFDHRALQFLVEIMGDQNVMFGTDYPFPLGEKEMGSLVRRSTLTELSKRRILGDNARIFFRL